MDLVHKRKKPISKEKIIFALFSHGNEILNFNSIKEFMLISLKNLNLNYYFKLRITIRALTVLCL